MKSLFIVNPRSGLRRRIDIAALIGSHAAAGEITTCQEKEQLDDIVRQAESSGVEAIYAVGGDGTVHEIARRLIGTKIALGILPLGSGNGLARHLGIPLRIERALEACREADVVTIDTAAVNGEPFVGVMGAGLDAVIAERFAGSAIRGLRTYVRVGLNAFRDFAPEDFEIEIDGVRSQRRAFIVAVANSSQYGNNARIAPRASLQDGLLDVVIIEDVSLFAAPLMLLRLFNGTFRESERVKLLQGRTITIRRSAAGPAHVDGEPMIMAAELKVDVVPQSLRVLVPKRRGQV
jgi:YegS/Rv2252/BmrU family lipid kinase